MQNSALKDRLQRYFKDFCAALKEQIKVVQSKFLSQSQILEYLRNNKNARVKLRDLLECELSHLKATRPDIIDTWSDYKDFVDMCEEMDSIESSFAFG